MCNLIASISAHDFQIDLISSGAARFGVARQRLKSRLRIARGLRFWPARQGNLHKIDPANRTLIGAICESWHFN